MSIRVAYMRIAAIFIDCPHCGEGLPAGENFSYLITGPLRGSGPMPTVPGTVVICHHCIEKYRIPASVKVLE